MRSLPVSGIQGMVNAELSKRYTLGGGCSKCAFSLLNIILNLLIAKIILKCILLLKSKTLG